MANYTLANLPSKFAIGDTITFSYTGAIQTFPLLNQKDIKVECWGAQGGTGFCNGDSELYYSGNLGGYLVGRTVQNQSLSVYVGSKGGNAGRNLYNTAWSGAAGWSDGTAGGTAIGYECYYYYGGGGGSSSVRAPNIVIMSRGGDGGFDSYGGMSSPTRLARNGIGGGSQQCTGATLISQSTGVQSGNGKVVITILSLNNLFLIQDGTSIKTWNGTALTDVGTAPATDTMFTSNGSSNLSGITKAILSTLSSPKVLLKRGDNVATSLKYTGTPLPKLVLSSGDITLSPSVSHVDSFNLSANIAATSAMRVIVSFDSGSTWRTYKDSIWKTVDHTKLSEVKANGLSVAEFNALDSANWTTQLLGDYGSKKVRFGYYMEVNSLTDYAESDILTMQVDMNGAWELSTLNTDYQFYYAQDKVISIALIANGDFRISVL